MVNKLKIKVMKNLVKTINSLREDEQIKVMYNGEEYFIQCLLEFNTGGKSMSMYKKSNYGSYKSMNIDKITNKYISLYTYDMFENRNTVKIKIADISIPEEVETEQTLSL
jgi:hypothetical protein